MWIGALIAACDRTWNRADGNESQRRLAGTALVVLLLAAGVGSGLAVERLTGLHWIGLPVLVFLGTTCLAQRSLYIHVEAVQSALDRGDLAAARESVGMIVGRDTAEMTEADVIRAALESLAESFSDGVVAPAFWMALGGLPGGFAYKAINTADSMVGHLEPSHRAFGWASARLDDLLNLVPARIAGALICLAAGSGWACMIRDARLHASPNAGWPEAALAGGMGIRLGGTVSYDGISCRRPTFGQGNAEVILSDMARGLSIYRRACLLGWLLLMADILLVWNVLP